MAPKYTHSWCLLSTWNTFPPSLYLPKPFRTRQILWVPLSLHPPLTTTISVSNPSLDKLPKKVVCSHWFHLLSSYSYNSLLSSSFLTTPGQTRSPTASTCYQIQRMLFIHLTWQFRSPGNHSLLKIFQSLAFIKWLSPGSLNSPPFPLQAQHSLSSK